jgi:hypothetical protein
MGSIKGVLLGIFMTGLSIASVLSFLSMGLIVSLFFLPTLSYGLIFIVPLFLSLFLLASQTIPGYFAMKRKYMILTLILSALLVGILFSLLNVVKGILYGACCGLGNWIGFYIRSKQQKDDDNMEEVK